MSTSSHLTLSLKNDLAEITRASAAVDELGERHHAAPEALYAVNLALEEVLTNTISYGYDDGAAHEIIVHFSMQDGELTLTITDDARPFDPLQAPAPDVNAALEDRPVGGLGIHLAKTMMDGMHYRYESGKNILTMKKKIA
ncbi:ATP-binding protein [candidate division KSB1 bacterium]|nr:ATP-binding protein [candidate division KSB1 bacterium]